MQGVVARRNNFNEPILRLPGGGARGVREADRPLLRSPHPIQDRGRGHRVRLAGLGGREHRGRGRLPAPEGEREGRVDPPERHPPVPGGGRGRGARAARRTSIVLERTDESLAGANPLGRDIRTALTKALASNGHPGEAGIPRIALAEMPRLFDGVYGLGSRDFRPEHVLGAYEYATGQTQAQGRPAARRTAPPSSCWASTIPTRSSPRTRRRSCPRAPSPSASTRSAAGAPSPPARTSARSSATSTTSSPSATTRWTSSAGPARSSTSAPTPSTARRRRARRRRTSSSWPRSGSG